MSVYRRWMLRALRFTRSSMSSIIAGILLFFLYLMIFGFSGQNGEESGSLSHLISEKCVEIINSLSGRHWTVLMQQQLATYFEHPIRKLAHFSEYAVMGILVYILWKNRVIFRKNLFLLVTLWVFLSAGLDEFHQLFVPGRYGCFADVCLDTCGGMFGFLLMFLWEKVRDRGKGKKEMKTKSI